MPDNGFAQALLRAPASGLAAFCQDSRWRIAADPVTTLRVEAGDGDNLRTLPRRVDEELKRYPEGIAVGLLGYHAGRLLHGPTTGRASALPAAVVRIYGQAPQSWPAAPDPGLQQSATRQRPQARFREDWPRDHYMAAMEKIRYWLEAGDVYQVNLARRFSLALSMDPRRAWLALLARHPAPHACYMDWGEGQVFGASPERFLAIRGGRVVTEPIKGSRPRGATDPEDRELAMELTESAKDRAENLMIVDLLRNDLGRICQPGSIRAEPLFELRRFSNVQHLVSSVQGRLRPEILPLEALLACFPGGSITGAPKHRAMEIIAELEPVPRDFYCGSFFHLDADGNLDSNILIRTLQHHQGVLHCHGGGGIVHDSVPEQEYREGLFKVEKLMQVVEEAL